MKTAQTSLGLLVVPALLFGLWACRGLQPPAPLPAQATATSNPPPTIPPWVNATPAPSATPEPVATQTSAADTPTPEPVPSQTALSPASPSPPEPLPSAPSAPTPTLSSLPIGLKEELFFNEGGATGGECPAPDSALSIPTPQITISERLAWSPEEYQLCVYGFPVDEAVFLTLTGPASAGGETFISGPKYPSAGGPGSPSLVTFYFWMPAGLPAGIWEATARSAGQAVQVLFDNRFTETAINTAPVGGIDPFVNKNCYSYEAFDLIQVYGANYPPNLDQLPLGIYIYTGPGLKYSLFREYSTSTDNQGAFSITIQVEPGDPSGPYLVTPGFYPEAKDVYTFSNWSIDCYSVP